MACPPGLAMGNETWAASNNFSNAGVILNVPGAFAGHAQQHMRTGPPVLDHLNFLVLDDGQGPVSTPAAFKALAPFETRASFEAPAIVDPRMPPGARDHRVMFEGQVDTHVPFGAHSSSDTRPPLGSQGSRSPFREADPFQNESQPFGATRAFTNQSREEAEYRAQIHLLGRQHRRWIGTQAAPVQANELPQRSEGLQYAGALQDHKEASSMMEVNSTIEPSFTLGRESREQGQDLEQREGDLT